MLWWCGGVVRRGRKVRDVGVGGGRIEFRCKLDGSVSPKLHRTQGKQNKTMSHFGVILVVKIGSKSPGNYSAST